MNGTEITKSSVMELGFEMCGGDHYNVFTIYQKKNQFDTTIAIMFKNSFFYEGRIDHPEGDWFLSLRNLQSIEQLKMIIDVCL